MSSITFADFVIGVIVLASAFLSLSRGLFREVLTVSAWVLAGVASFVLYLVILPAVGGHDDAGWLVKSLLMLGLFGVMLLVFLRINVRVLEHGVPEGEPVPPPGTVDQALGFGFGLLRGIVLVAVLYHVHVMVYGERRTPDWLSEAQLFPVIEGTADGLNRFLPSTIKWPEARDESATRRQLSTVRKERERRRRAEETGYSRDDREAIDRLFRNSGTRR